MSGINLQNAGLFSAAAYTPIGQAVDLSKLPSGWVEITPAQATKYSDSAADNNPDGKNEFRVFLGTDPNVKQIVIAFKGTNNVSNWKSDLTPSDQGASAYAALRLQAQAVLTQLGADYPGYKN